MYATIHGTTCRLRLPAADEFLLPGIRWGVFDELLTPAFWRSQAWLHQRLGTYADNRLGRSLIEEAAACLLGGFGMRAELGLMAYARVRERGLLRGRPREHDLEDALAEPFVVNGKSQRYRFPRQKGRYLAACVSALHSFQEPRDDVRLRDELAKLPGIGLKTASWIVRNHRRSNKVAIVDVHILRAGRHIGLFSEQLHPTRHYRPLETAFLTFAKAIHASAGMLDALM
jgi:thermostable 8-oxoguanine DNA glycosylase